MSHANSFLSGAQNRLLPASVPFRFFVAAAAFHVLFWVLLLLGASDLADFSGGPGIVLAAIHALTLGVLSMTAIGAAFQLLPVATRQPLGRTWPATLTFWLFALGSGALVWGMATGGNTALSAGGLGAGAGLILFAVLTGDNLRRAGRLALVAAHGWLAIAVLAGIVGLGISLIVDFRAGFLGDHQAVARAHMILAAFGFMGVLATGFSRLLIPMFALSRSPSERAGWVHLGMTALALLTYISAQISGARCLGVTALILGLGAAVIYIWQMHATLRTRMRKRLGLLFLPIIGSWIFLFAGLGIALFALGTDAPKKMGVLFGFLVLAGWLLTFLLGVLQRIMPFLASMHASNSAGIPPLLSELTPAIPLKIHVIFHFTAVISCAIGIGLASETLISLGAIAGIISSLSFGLFTARILFKLSRNRDN